MTATSIDTINNLSKPELYINRELSFLAFNERVLQLGFDPQIPLLERLRYLCISNTNLDEFFEIRVSGLKQQVLHNIETRGPDDLSPRDQLDIIADQAHQLVEKQYELFNNVLVPELEKESIRFVRRTHWDTAQAEWIKNYFHRELLPVLSPLGLDPAHPFPRVLNKSLNFVVTLEGRDAFGRTSNLAIVQAPRALPRLIQLPKSQCPDQYCFVFLSSIIHAHVNSLFPGMQVTGCYQFRVTRNSDLFVDEEEINDLKRALEGELPSRNYGAAVRLEVADNCPEETTAFLLKQFHLDPIDLYQVNGPVNLNRLSAVIDMVDRPELKFPLFTPSTDETLNNKSIFSILDRKDIVLSHPYQSFNPVIEFLRQSATDKDVLAIKMTIYRTGNPSRIVDHLESAARSGKEVTAIIELKARYDEENNIRIANRLQEAGAHVVYGVVGYKTHAKMLLVVRRHKGRMKRYVHLGTGNYHPGTAKAYTDLGYLTSNRYISEDVHKIFQQLTGLGKATRLSKLLEAPFTLHSKLITLIKHEAEMAQQGRPARIIARMNSLLEPQIIQALYQASQAGVKIDLIVRGICALRPGLPGVSENIRVRSILGRFLEHSRIFYFQRSDDSPLLMASSADWMPRNFFRRVELAFPFEDEKLAERIKKEYLDWYLDDNTQAWELMADGNYQRISSKRKPFSAQAQLLTTLANQNPYTLNLS